MMSSYEVDIPDMDEFDRLLLAQPDLDFDTEFERMRANVSYFDEYMQGVGNPSVDMDMNTGERPYIANTTTTPRTLHQSRGPPAPPVLTIEPPLLDLGQPVNPINAGHVPHPHMIPRAGAPQRPEIFEARENIAFVFGMEHVLMYKGRLLPAAASALRILIDNNVPFGLFTNDDGFRDGDQEEQLVALLSAAGITIDRQAIVNYNYPFRTIARDLCYAEKDVLIVSGYGEIRVRALAQRAGFRADRIWTPATLGINLDVPIAAIMVWSQPHDWDRDLKVICRVLSKYRGGIRLFVCNEDFNRATDFQYPSTDYWTFYHLLCSRQEWSDDDRKRWLDEILLAPWVNNFKVDVFFTFEGIVARMCQESNINMSKIKKMYFVTENYQRDIRQLIRHEDMTVPRAPAWEIIPIANIGREPNWWVHPDAHLDYIVNDRGTIKWKYVIDYQPERQFTDVYSAVRSLLATHIPSPKAPTGR